MRKLKLDLDALTVEAFETVEEAVDAGTVVGHAPPTRTLCGGSCVISCVGGSCPCTSPDETCA